jgi:hypothetical protein
VGPKAGLDVLEKTEVSCPRPDSNLGPSIPQNRQNVNNNNNTYKMLTTTTTTIHTNVNNSNTYKMLTTTIQNVNNNTYKMLTIHTKC